MLVALTSIRRCAILMPQWIHLRFEGLNDKNTHHLFDIPYKHHPSKVAWHNGKLKWHFSVDEREKRENVYVSVFIYFFLFFFFSFINFFIMLNYLLKMACHSYSYYVAKLTWQELVALKMI